MASEKTSSVEYRSLRNPKITTWVRYVHIYSAIPVLLLMVFFAVTGLFLNHPEWGQGEISKRHAELEAPNWLAEAKVSDDNASLMGLKLLQWLDNTHQIRAVEFEIEWEADEQLLILTLDGPNGNSVVEYSFEEPDLVLVDQRTLSLLATLNNIHRVKHVSGFWIIMSDLSALCMVVFCITGLWLVWVNKKQRFQGTNWFVLGSGLFVLSVYLMH